MGTPHGELLPTGKASRHPLHASLMGRRSCTARRPDVATRPTRSSGNLDQSMAAFFSQAASFERCVRWWVTSWSWVELVASQPNGSNGSGERVGRVRVAFRPLSGRTCSANGPWHLQSLYGRAWVLRAGISLLRISVSSWMMRSAHHGGICTASLKIHCALVIVLFSAEI